MSHLHQNTATKSLSLRILSSCLAVTSSITDSPSLLAPPVLPPPRDPEESSCCFVLATASTRPIVPVIARKTVKRVCYRYDYNDDNDDDDDDDDDDDEKEEEEEEEEDEEDEDDQRMLPWSCLLM
ncbi:hypothetical protein HZH68_013910 [Vespula germanica]|uniref:Uncharacterized protein n=1 Tax=Vespula germanica TaxID=30212 RepID=A0A834JCG7_VESGE|nr:hypothetical protein HZH68_013910 [Vespula germanica]